MNAKYELLIKFYIAQQLDDFSTLIDPHHLGELVSREICDLLTESKCAVCYEVENAKIDIK